MKRVGYYARVSSAKQARELTIDSQIAELKNRISEDGFSLEKDFEFADEGYSGSTLLRPALEKLRDAASNSVISLIYILAPDRLARNYAYQYLLLEELEKAGVEVVFLGNSFEKNPESNLLMQVHGMISEYERTKIMERNRRGKIHAAKQGRVSVLSQAPYGYTYISRHIDGKGSFIVNAPQAKVMKQVFNWIAVDGLSLNEATKRLTEAGVPTPSGKNIRWNRASLARIIRNQAYIGKAAFGKTKSVDKKPRIHLIRGQMIPGKSDKYPALNERKNWIVIPVPAIIDREIFEAVQERLEENKKRKRERKSGIKFLLRGIIVCEKCQFSFTGNTNGKKLGYYTCTGTRNYSNRKAFCNNKSINANVLEEVVFEEIKEILNNPRRIEKEYHRRLEELQGCDHDDERKKKGREKLKIEKSTSRLIDSYTDGLIEKEEFEPRIKHLRESLGRVLIELHRISLDDGQKTHLSLIIGKFEEFAKRVRSQLDDISWEKKRGDRVSFNKES